MKLTHDLSIASDIGKVDLNKSPKPAMHSTCSTSHDWLALLAKFDVNFKTYISSTLNTQETRTLHNRLYHVWE